MRGVCLILPVLASFLSGEFLLHIPYLVDFSLGSFSYTSYAGFDFIWGISLTHPVLASVLSGEFFSDTSRAGFNFVWGVSLTDPICMRGISLTHPELASFVCWVFL